MASHFWARVRTNKLGKASLTFRGGRGGLGACCSNIPVADRLPPRAGRIPMPWCVQPCISSQVSVAPLKGATKPFSSGGNGARAIQRSTSVLVRLNPLGGNGALATARSHRRTVAVDGPMGVYLSCGSHQAAVELGMMLN